MKKIPTLLAALAIACGTAYAGTAATTAGKHDQTTTASAEQPKEGLGAKTKRAFHRMGQKLRSIGHKDTEHAQGDDTRAMGAAPSDAQDGARRQRMDDAYANWKNKQK